MSVSEPAWFEPEPFCRQVLNYSFREFGVIQLETAEELNSYPQEFKEAVQIVGRAVFNLQLFLHDKLRPQLVESLNIAAGVERDNVKKDIRDFMVQGYLCRDIFNFTISSLAVVAEMIFFMYEFGLPIPYYWLPFPWCGLYECRLKDELCKNGGWERLLLEAPSRYGSHMRILLETEAVDYVPNLPVVERNEEIIWPEFRPEALLQSFPNSRYLAMEMLRTLYMHEQLVPEPGKGAHVIRMMLGLKHLTLSERIDGV